MLQEKILLTAVILLGLGLIGLRAQESVNASGGNASGIGGSAGYSVGQVVYTTINGTNGSVSHGVQQAYEISVVSSLEETDEANVIISVFPNPATDFITLTVDPAEYQSLFFILYDINGTIIRENKVTFSDTEISMLDLPPATYFLKLADNGKDVKVFKIIKTR